VSRWTACAAQGCVKKHDERKKSGGEGNAAPLEKIESSQEARGGSEKGAAQQTLLHSGRSEKQKRTKAVRDSHKNQFKSSIIFYTSRLLFGLYVAVAVTLSVPAVSRLLVTPRDAVPRVAMVI
jgi:hypothetical protein